ncbi:cytochrome P450 6k1-like [Diachasma alloeum]|uniref:cytochrome P450 6k1-like n=1 Tax=Diachasma alloeum TaxID=454923 RepID=UPI000738502D|nr:cytochrome P450 6k1-like [Diachasma alloeum]
MINTISVALISVFPLFFLFFIYANYKLNYWKRRGVEQLPNTDLFFGHFKNGVLFRTAPGLHLGKLHRAAKKDSPFVGFYILHKPCLLLREPEIIKQVLIKDFDKFPDRHFAGNGQKDSLGMKNLFGVKSPTWKVLRRKITPVFTIGKIKQMFPLMAEVGENMTNYLKDQKIQQSGTRIIDVQELNYKFTTDIIASIALGMETDTFSYPDTEFSKFVSNMFHGFKRKVALVLLFFVPNLVEKIDSYILTNFNFIRKLFWTAIEERERIGSKRGDFIDSLVKLKNGEQNPVYKFERDNLIHQLGVFFAGLESSSTTTSFTLMELAKNKQCQDRAREDILRAIAEHGWGYEAINDMKYLDQCFAEGLRLHPPVPTIDRVTRGEYKIPGTDIILESGTPIYISLYGLHDDPRFFEDAESFKPERFEKGEEIPTAYMPFGLGPRQCIGMKLGQLFSKIVLSIILKDYEIHQNLEDEYYLDSRSTLTTAANGIVLHLRKLET